jgi:hypothetical protein
MTLPQLRWFLAFAVALAAAALVRADNDSRDLGGGLSYIRLHSLAEPVPPTSGIVVLDLRYATLPPEGEPAALREFLGVRRPLRVVIYDQTPAADLAALLVNRDASVVTIAPAGATPTPDVAVAIEPAADRAAYDALDAGTRLAALADPASNKRRLDEAALVRARARRGEPTTPNTAPATNPADTPPASTESSVATPVDRLLQHAVRVARGLQALGRG